MRVIAGTFRGRQLRSPTGAATRPTGDRVREAIFDVLGSMLSLEGARVLDLYAGSGAMGIEALSRGADAATFVERDIEALSVIRANLAGLGLAGRATVVRADVADWLARAQGGGQSRPGPFDPVPFKVALCDPPYAFDDWTVLLGQLPAEVAVLESSRPVPQVEGWDTARSKRYGGTLVTVVRRPPDGLWRPSVERSPHQGTPEKKGTQ